MLKQNKWNLEFYTQRKYAARIEVKYKHLQETKIEEICH